MLDTLSRYLHIQNYNYVNCGLIGGYGLIREGQTLSGIYQQVLSFRKKNNESNDSSV